MFHSSFKLILSKARLESPQLFFFCTQAMQTKGRTTSGQAIYKLHQKLQLERKRSDKKSEFVQHNEGNVGFCHFQEWQSDPCLTNIWVMGKRSLGHGVTDIEFPVPGVENIQISNNKNLAQDHKGTWLYLVRNNYIHG